MTIGEKIKARRNELQWSQRTLSDKMGYKNHSIITKIEAGKVDLPQSKIAKFAEVLGVDVAYLMGWKEVQKKNDALTDIVVRLRTDNEFAIFCEKAGQLSPEQFASVMQVVDTFLSMKG